MLLSFQDISSLMRYAACIYIIVSLVSLGLLFNQNALFPWLEMIRCLAVVGYSMYQPFTAGSLAVTLLLYAVKIFFLYSAWMCKLECVRSFRNKTNEEKSK